MQNIAFILPFININQPAMLNRPPYVQQNYVVDDDTPSPPVHRPPPTFASHPAQALRPSYAAHPGIVQLSLLFYVYAYVLPSMPLCTFPGHSTPPSLAAFPESVYTARVNQVANWIIHGFPENHPDEAWFREVEFAVLCQVFEDLNPRSEFIDAVTSSALDIFAALPSSDEEKEAWEAPLNFVRSRVSVVQINGPTDDDDDDDAEE